jgi:hypothetical protein
MTEPPSLVTPTTFDEYEREPSDADVFDARANALALRAWKETVLPHLRKRRRQLACERCRWPCNMSCVCARTSYVRTFLLRYKPLDDDRILAGVADDIICAIIVEMNLDESYKPMMRKHALSCLRRRHAKYQWQCFERESL